MTLSEKRLGDVRWANRQTEVEPKVERKEMPKKGVKKRDKKGNFKKNVVSRQAFLVHHDGLTDSI